MQVNKAQVEAVLKTLPIGFYLGRPASLRLDDAAETSYAEIMTDTLVIALKNVTDAAASIPASAEKYWDVERLTRCILYHEVGHLIYTHPRLTGVSYVEGLDPNELKNGLNAIEDERLERRLQPAVLGVDFPRFVKLVNGYAPEATPELPKNASPFDRLYAAVRYGVGSVADLRAVSDFWKTVDSKPVVLHNSGYYGGALDLLEKMIELVKHFYASQPKTEPQAGTPENVAGKGSPEKDEQSQGETPSQSHESKSQPETGNGTGGESGESTKKDNAENDAGESGGESREEGGEEDTGNGEKEETRAGEEEGKDGEETAQSGGGEEQGEEEQDADGYGEKNDGSEAESESGGDHDEGQGRESSVDNDAQQTEGKAEGGRGSALDESTRSEQALENLRQDINNAFDWAELAEGSPVKKSLDRLVKRYRTRAGSCRGEREEYAAGRVNARAVCLGEDKLFRDRGHGSGLGSQKIALTAWIDVSSSFSYAGPKLTQLVKALRRAERESGGKLVVDVVAMGAWLTNGYVPESNIESAPNDGLDDAVILKKTAEINPRSDNRLSNSYIWCHKKTRHPDAKQFDLVVFDGLTCHSRPTPEEKEAAKIWDNPRTFILSDVDNKRIFDPVCHSARKQYMESGYAEKLEELVAEVLERL